MVYLNGNSTYVSSKRHAGGNRGYCIFNPSDILYPEVAEARDAQSRLESYIKDFLHCGEDFTVVFNSGATESISNCIFWASRYLPGGVVYGSTLDHPSVEKACNTFDMEYEEMDGPDNTFDLPTKQACSCIFVTAISGVTGEIYPMDKFVKETKKIVVNGPTSNKYSMMYKPLYVADLSQSINKLPFDNSKYNFDAIIFAPHKIGGPKGVGVMVVRTGLINGIQRSAFRPLIPGTQMNGYRGGTYDINQILAIRDILRVNAIDVDTMFDKWDSYTEWFTKYGCNVIQPKMPHIGNTIVISVGRNYRNIIKVLAENDYYVGAITACSLENSSEKDTNSYIRISFDAECPLTEKDVKKMCEIIHENE